jgi:HAD superfamily hydrolase (TIGR01490 family)
MSTARVAAFFDLDLTLLRCNSGSRWMSFLRERGEVGAWMMLRSLLWLTQYKLAILDMERLATHLIADLRGDSELEMRDKASIFWEREVRPALSELALAALAEHQAQAHVVALLSSTTQFIAEPVAAHLGIEHILCTRLHVESGRFLGTCERPTCYGQGKVFHAERFAAEHHIDLGQSYFYTDSYSDLPMLLKVGGPRAVNPDRRLRRHAQRAGWPILAW